MNSASRMIDWYQHIQMSIYIRTHPSKIRQHKIRDPATKRIWTRDFRTSDQLQRYHLAGKLLYPAYARYRHHRIPSAGSAYPADYQDSEKDTGNLQKDENRRRYANDLSYPDRTHHLTDLIAHHGHIPPRLRRQHDQLSLLRLLVNTDWLLIYIHKKKGLTSPFQISNFKL